MVGRRLLGLGVAAIVASAATTFAFASNWVHPAFSGGSGPGAPRVVTGAATSKSLTASASNKTYGASATGTAQSAGTTTTTTATNAALGTTSQSVTTYGSPTSVNVTVSFNLKGDFTTSPVTFTFANLSAPAQTQSAGFIKVTATPNAATNSVTVTYGPGYYNGEFFGTAPQSSMTLTFASPASTSTGSSSGAAATTTSPQIPTAMPTTALGEPDPVGEVREASQAAQAAIQACNINAGTCVADALDAYATKLEALVPRLPPQLHTLPGIVRGAAQKVRVARTKAEAVSAVKMAIVQVDKTIALLRAEDPNAAKIGSAVGRAVDQTLDVAENKLLRASEL